MWLVAVTVALFILVIWTVWGNTALTINYITVSSKDIPEEFSGFRIAQISDLHNAEFGKNNHDLLQRLSETSPDIIVITGDLFDSRHTDVSIAFNLVKQAMQIAPVYYVTGNHESRLLQYEEMKKSFELTGVSILEDAAVQLNRNGESITLIGLSDPDFTIKGDLFGEVPAMIGTKLKNLTDGENNYTILLSHRPELFETYVKSSVNLVFCGHAHGGQFRFPFIGGLFAPGQGFFPKYDAGNYTKGNTNMIVSRGLGNSIIPIRFNNRPEIVLAELCSAS